MASQTTLERPAAAPSRSGRCNGCGYELRGLDRRGQCPECGAAYEIDETLSPETNGWLRAVSLGLRYGWPVPFIAAGVVAWMLDPNGRAAGAMRSLAGLVILIGFFGMLALPANAWVQSRLLRGPRSQRHARGSTLRVVIAIVLAVTWLAGAAAYLLFTMMLRGFAQQSW